MRKTALLLILLTLWGISATFLTQEALSQDTGPNLRPASRSDRGSVIDSIVNDFEIVIDDSRYRIDIDATFYASDGKTLIRFRDFKEGNQVDFLLNDNGEIIKLSKRAER